VATLPLDAEAAAALLHRTVSLLGSYRDLGLPLVHVLTCYRAEEEILSNPFWRVQAGRRDSVRSRIAEHNLHDGPGVALMPGIAEPGDIVVRSKKRYDCFVATELEFVLRSGRHDSVLLLGVNTNSCVLATGIAASVRDFAAFIVDDAVDTMMGPELDGAARAVFEASFGWVIRGAETLRLLGARRAEAQVAAAS
jgi:nicotinamidase-related amidase